MLFRVLFKYSEIHKKDNFGKYYTITVEHFSVIADRFQGLTSILYGQHRQMSKSLEKKQLCDEQLQPHHKLCAQFERVYSVIT
jgi:hypothetical protein